MHVLMRSVGDKDRAVAMRACRSKQNMNARTFTTTTTIPHNPLPILTHADTSTHNRLLQLFSSPCAGHDNSLCSALLACWETDHHYYWPLDCICILLLHIFTSREAIVNTRDT